MQLAEKEKKKKLSLAEFLNDIQLDQHRFIDRPVTATQIVPRKKSCSMIMQ